MHDGPDFCIQAALFQLSSLKLPPSKACLLFDATPPPAGLQQVQMLMCNLKGNIQHSVPFMQRHQKFCMEAACSPPSL